MGFLDKFPHKEKLAVAAGTLIVMGGLLLTPGTPDVRDKLSPSNGYFVICSNVNAQIVVRNNTGRVTAGSNTPDHGLGTTNIDEIRAKDLLRKEPSGDWTQEVSLERSGFQPKTVVVTKAMTAGGMVPSKPDPVIELSPNLGSQAFYVYLWQEKKPGVFLLFLGVVVLIPVLFALRREKIFLKKLQEAVANAEDDPFVGKEISDYQLWERVGKGGFGQVYRATAGRSGREYALKVIPYDKIATELVGDCKARFEREMKVIKGFSHPAITNVIDYGQTPNYDWCLMPLYTGGSLEQAIKNKTLTPEALLKYAGQMAAGLQACHDKHVLHRDFKPANVMLSEGNAVIIDFGIAKDKESETLTKTGVGLGTLVYMAPEQTCGVTTPASDQYSYGITLFEMMTEASAFKEYTNINQTLTEKFITDIKKMFAERLPEGYEEVVDVLCRMTNDEPTSRYPKVSEAYEAFEKAYKATMS